MEKNESAPAPAPAAPVATPAPAPVEAPAAPKKKKTGLIVTIIIVILALIGGGVAAFFLLRKNPTDVVADAFINTAKTLSSDNSNVELDGSLKVSFSSIFSGDLTFKGKNSANGDMEAELGASLMGSNISADLISKDGKIYAKINGISKINSILDMFGGSAFSIPANSASMLKSIENKWIYTEATASDLSAMIAVPGIESIEDIKNVDINKEKFNEYFTVEAYSGDVVSKKLGDLYKLTIKDTSMTQGIDAFYIEVKDNNVVRLFATATVQGVTFTLDTTIAYPTSVEIIAPSEAKDLMTLMYGNYPSILELDEEDDDYEDLLNSLLDDEDMDYDDLLRMLDY